MKQQPNKPNFRMFHSLWTIHEVKWSTVFLKMGIFYSHVQTFCPKQNLHVQRLGRFRSIRL